MSNAFCSECGRQHREGGECPWCKPNRSTTTGNDIREFNAYLLQCTDNQVRGVYEREKQAGRDDYMALCRLYMQRQRRKRKPRASAAFGSIISGTVDMDELIPAFVDEIRRLRGRLTVDIQRNYRKWKAEGRVPEELLPAIFDELNNLAPHYGYFGALDGDDYGFWLRPNWQEDFDGLRVGDTSEVPEGHSGEVLHVNDHGNPTLYVAHKGKLHEIWSLV